MIGRAEVNMSSSPENSNNSRRRIILAGLYLFFVGGALCNGVHLLQPFMHFMTPFLLVAIGLLAVYLTYEVNLRSIAAILSVILLTFSAEVSGVNLGFPFGDYAYAPPGAESARCAARNTLWLAGDSDSELDCGGTIPPVQAHRCGIRACHGR